MERVMVVTAKGLHYETVITELHTKLTNVLMQFDSNENAKLEKIDYSTTPVPTLTENVYQILASAWVLYSVTESKKVDSKE